LGDWRGIRHGTLPLFPMKLTGKTAAWEKSSMRAGTNGFA
jgi:hypothetical protein